MYFLTQKRLQNGIYRSIWVYQYQILCSVCSWKFTRVQCRIGVYKGQRMGCLKCDRRAPKATPTLYKVSQQYLQNYQRKHEWGGGVEVPFWQCTLCWLTFVKQRLLEFDSKSFHICDNEKMQDWQFLHNCRKHISSERKPISALKAERTFCALFFYGVNTNKMSNLYIKSYIRPLQHFMFVWHKPTLALKLIMK